MCQAKDAPLNYFGGAGEGDAVDGPGGFPGRVAARFTIILAVK